MRFSNEENYEFNLNDEYEEYYNKNFFHESEDYFGIKCPDESNMEYSTENTEKNIIENHFKFKYPEEPYLGGSTESTEKNIIENPFSVKNTPENENMSIASNEDKEERNNHILFENVSKNEQINKNESYVLIPEKEEKVELYEDVTLKEDKTKKIVDIKMNIEGITDDKCKTEEYVGKKRRENYSTEKITKKVRIVVLKAIIHFINEKIKLFYNNNIGRGLKEMKFKEIDKTTLSHSKVDYDKEFLNFPLKTILSWDISGKITNYLREHNKKLVEKLTSSETCSEYFIQLFNMTFLQCLEHIQNGKHGILNGLMTCRKMFEEFCDEKEIKDEEYYSIFETILMEYQVLIEKKTSRKSRKKND